MISYVQWTTSLHSFLLRKYHYEIWTLPSIPPCINLLTIKLWHKLGFGSYPSWYDFISMFGSPIPWKGKTGQARIIFYDFSKKMKGVLKETKLETYGRILHRKKHGVRIHILGIHGLDGNISVLKRRKGVTLINELACRIWNFFIKALLCYFLFKGLHLLFFIKFFYWILY